MGNIKKYQKLSIHRNISNNKENKIIQYKNKWDKSKSMKALKKQ